MLLLEVGLGGRLDATNVIEQPLATVITPVSFDHAEFLGDTLDKVAAEKAGILKRGVPAIVAAQPREALAVIERQAARLKAPVRIAGEDWTASEERGRLVYQDDAGLLDLPAPKLHGRHQFENAGVAIAALRASGMKLPPTAFENGVAKADWPARMQRLPAGRLTALAPPAASSGSTAATTPTAGASSPRRSPISRNACRGRSFSSSACWRPRTAGVPEEFCRPRPAGGGGTDPAPGEIAARRSDRGRCARRRHPDAEQRRYRDRAGRDRDGSSSIRRRAS